MLLTSQTFSVSGPSSITEDPTDGDSNTATYTVSYSGSLGTSESASVDVSHTLNQTSSSDYSSTVYSAIATAVASTPGTSFNSGTGQLTFTNSTATTTSTATAYPSVASDAGDGDYSWSNLSNATGNNASNAASQTGVNHHDTANTIRLKGFGLSIPTGATITGITVTLTTTGSNNSSSAVKLTKNGTSSVGTAPSPSGTWSSGTVVHGSSSSLWGTTWTAAELNSSNFGLLIQPHGSGSSDNFYIYNAKVDVTYTTTTTISPTSLTFSVPIVNDSDVEGDEAYSIGIANAQTTSSGGASISTGSVATTIIDNDISFSISGGGTVTELTTDGDDNEATFTVGYSGTLSSGKTATVTVAHTLNETVAGDFTNTLNSAIAAAITAGAPGVSYNSSTGVLTFSGGSGNATSLTFSLVVNDDTSVETDEDFSIQLSSASATSPFSATIGTSSAGSTIVSDDIPNDPPVFDEAEYSFTLLQDDPTDTIVGTLSATDPDVGATLTYSGPISSSEPFEIDSETGEITFVGTTAPSVGLRELTFQVMDEHGAYDTVSVDIDIVFRPVITSLELMSDPDEDGVTTQPFIRGYLDDDDSTDNLTIEFDIDGDGEADGSTISSSSDNSDFFLNLTYYQPSTVPYTNELLTAGTYTVYVRAGEKVEGIEGVQFGNWSSITFTYEEPDSDELGSAPTYTNSASGIMGDVASEYDGIANFDDEHNPANPESSTSVPSGVTILTGVVDPETFMDNSGSQVESPEEDYFLDSENQDDYLQQMGVRAGLFSGSSGGSFAVPSYSTLPEYAGSLGDAPVSPPLTTVVAAPGYSASSLIPGGFTPNSSATETMTPAEPSGTLPSSAWTASTLPSYLTAGSITGIGSGQNPGASFGIQNSAAATAVSSITPGTSYIGTTTVTASMSYSGLLAGTPPTPKFAGSTIVGYFSQEVHFEFDIADTGGNELHVDFTYALGGWTESLALGSGTYDRFDSYVLLLVSGTQVTPGGLATMWNAARSSGGPNWVALTNWFSYSGEWSLEGDIGYNYIELQSYEHLDEPPLGHTETVISGHIGECYVLAPVGQDVTAWGEVDNWYISIETDNVSYASANGLYSMTEYETFNNTDQALFSMNVTTGAYGVAVSIDTTLRKSLLSSEASIVQTGSVTQSDAEMTSDWMYLHTSLVGGYDQTGASTGLFIRDGRRILVEGSSNFTVDSSSGNAIPIATGSAQRLQDWIIFNEVAYGQYTYVMNIEMYLDAGAILTWVGESVTGSYSYGGYLFNTLSSFGQNGIVIWSNFAGNINGNIFQQVFFNIEDNGIAVFNADKALAATQTDSGTVSQTFDGSGTHKNISGTYTSNLYNNDGTGNYTSSWNSSIQVIGSNLSGYLVQASDNVTDTIDLGQHISADYAFTVAAGTSFGQPFAGGTYNTTYERWITWTGFNTITASDSYTIPIGYTLYYDPGEGERSAGYLSYRSDEGDFSCTSMEINIGPGFTVDIVAGSKSEHILTTSNASMTLAAGDPLSAAVITNPGPQVTHPAPTGVNMYIFDGVGGGTASLMADLDGTIDDWLILMDL